MDLFDSKKVNIQITEQFTDATSRLNRETKAKIVDVQSKLFNNEEIIKQDANLLSVAITRARKTAWISYNGTPSEYIPTLREE